MSHVITNHNHPESLKKYEQGYEQIKWMSALQKKRNKTKIKSNAHEIKRGKA